MPSKFNIAVKNLNPRKPIRISEVKKLITFCLNSQKITKAAEVSVVFVTDTLSKSYHKNFMNINTSTDIITFDLSDSSKKFKVDCVISTDTAYQNAKRYGMSFKQEVYYYVIHGILHVCGYDDTTLIKSKRMHARQTVLLNQFLKKG